MRRTDRLFELIQLFRSGRFWRGRDLAERLEVSLRTVYRDIDTLVASGVPIEGERGVGYILRSPIFLPPLTLTMLELEALHLGCEVVRQSADPDLAGAAGALRDKIDAVLPEERRAAPRPATSVYLPAETGELAYLTPLRRAIAGRQVLEIAYDRLDGTATHRRVRPLHLQYWGRVWTCAAWCELRADFRVFRVDRIRSWQDTGEIFVQEQGQRYEDFIAQYEDPAG